MPVSSWVFEPPGQPDSGSPTAAPAPITSLAHSLAGLELTVPHVEAGNYTFHQCRDKQRMAFNKAEAIAWHGREAGRTHAPISWAAAAINQV